MNRNLRIPFVFAAGIACALAGCTPPMVLVGHSYATSDKAVETIIQRSGATAKSGDDKVNLFNVYMRVCDQGANNSQANCKDSLVLNNVNPTSL